MSLSVEIRKKLGQFHLEVCFHAKNVPLALLGASGCGKSVTLRCIAGIMRPDEGHIELDGQVLFDSTAHINLPPQRREVGYLFQNYALFPNMTVRQNIAVAVRDKTLRETETTAMIRRFRLDAVANQLPSQLSGGQQQRTALARILSSGPKALLLDEPFSALDSYLKYQLELELYETLTQFSGAVIWVSHDRSEVWRNCPQVCVLSDGRSQPVQTTRDLFNTPDTESAARLSGCKNFVTAVPSGDTIDIPEWGVSLKCGRAVPSDIRSAGIRSRCIHLADETDVNQISCQIVRVIDNLQNIIVLLQPDGSSAEMPLQMELPDSQRTTMTAESRVTVSISPQDILLFR
jgi:molybdate transport system ATP-binding protein